MKEDTFHGSAKASYVASAKYSAFERKQILADSAITYSNAILHEKQQSGVVLNV
jgi:hypothetical protein